MSEKSKDTQEKRVKTWRLNGCGNKKRKETWANKTDKEIEEIQSKMKKTCKENHGFEFYSQSKEWKKETPSKISKTLSTKIEKGEFLPFGFNVNEIKKYCQENEIEYKGYTNIFQIPEIIKKCEQTKLEKHGDKHYVNSEKMKETMTERYGVENCMQNHDIFKKARKRYEFNGLNFDSKPELSAKMIKKYLNNYGTIIDPFSGFSGRLLGSYNCGKEYIGYDINEKHIQESKEIIDYKQIKNSAIYIEDLITAPIRTYENSALFTCPPYGGKEHWNKDNDEI